MKTREEEHLASVLIEARESGVEQVVFVAHGGPLAGVGRVVGVVTQVVRIHGGGRVGGFAEMIGGAAAGEVIHPGREAAVVAIGMAVFQHPLKNRLRDVLRGGTVAGELDQESKELPVMPLEKFAQRIEFAVTHGEHQIVIGERGSGLHGSGSAINHARGGMNMEF